LKTLLLLLFISPEILVINFKNVHSMQVAAKKKSVADEAGMVLQAKVKQLTAATTS